MGLLLCTLEPDICMQQNEEIYEYITVYVYELEIITSNPNNFIDALKNIHM